MDATPSDPCDPCDPSEHAERPTGQRRRARARMAVGVTVLLLACFGAGLAGAATGRYSDVPTSHTFYDEIEAVSAGCVLGGYADGTFRPGNNITRQAAAAAFARGLPALYVDETPSVFVNANTATTVASTTFTVPDLPDCTQHAQITGQLRGFIGNGCGVGDPLPYTVTIKLDGTTITQGWTGDREVTGFVQLTPGVHTATLSLFWSCPGGSSTNNSVILGVQVSALGKRT